MMKLKRWILLLILTVLVAGCTSPTVQSTQPGGTTATLPPPILRTTAAPDAIPAARAFLDAWETEDYPAMYGMLSLLSRDAISEETFTNRYRDIANTMNLVSLETETLSSLISSPTQAQVGYRATFTTALVGELTREMQMNLTLEDNTWKVAWEDGMIMPELRGGNRLYMDVKIPTRGNIYDRNGSAIVMEGEGVALGIVPGQIDPDREGRLLSELSSLTGFTTQYLQSLYEFAAPDWYIPVGDASAQAVRQRWDVLSTLSGLVMNFYDTRYYLNGGTAPHVTGYVQPIPAEALEEYQRQGYLGDEKVGMAGLEEWAEEDLGGRRAASLFVIDTSGQFLSRLAQVDAIPSASITTTIDKNLQVEVQKALADFRGAIVVVERDTGRVLAMASSPSFNPNLFDANNYNSAWMLGDMLNAAENRLFNRAAQTGYPLGSVFKIISMAAAMETGIFTEESVYECGYTFNDLPGVTFYDWTYEKEVAASGTLTLPEGLMRSCNIWFYHIGLELNQMGRPNAITDMALAFGLGKPTGIEGIPEIAGSVHYPATEADSVQQAIGQGAMLVTPLQVAAFIAAIGNGGTLYRPQVVEKISLPDGTNTYEFEPVENGTLPVSENTLDVIQRAMRSVVANTRGTAYYALAGLNVPIYGKTGTAQNPFGDPHAWFAGYTNTNREDKPDIAVVVLAENAGEGSEIGAPIFRRVVEVYYTGKPSRLYPWESSYYVTRTETPEP